MSATNRGGQRSKNDNYQTPAWCVWRLLEACPLPGGRWLEPACGDGAIVRASNTVRHDVKWLTGDVREAVGVDVLADFLDPLVWKSSGPFDVIITNPPYSLAMEFVERALALALRGHVAMLLRLPWLASARRAIFLRMQMPDVYVLPNRPSFTGRGTDATDYAWFVWTPARTRATSVLRVLATTPREERTP